MKVFTCNEFEGHYPVGVGAVVVAENVLMAAKWLENALSERGLTQEILPEQMKEIGLDSRKVRILCDGNY